MSLAILGAGPHGRQLAALTGGKLYDDNLPKYPPCWEAVGEPWLAGACWPKVRRQIVAKTPGDPWQRGTFLFPGAQIGQDVELGCHVHVGYNAVISHGCQIGDCVTICSGAVLCGEVLVEDDVFIGANATIIHGGIKVGQGAVIGAGAVVRDNVVAMTVVR